MESFGLGNITESNHAPNTSSSATSAFPGRKSKKRREIPELAQPPAPGPNAEPCEPGGSRPQPGSSERLRVLLQRAQGGEREMGLAKAAGAKHRSPSQPADTTRGPASLSASLQHPGALRDKLNGPAMTAQSLPNLRELQKVWRVQEGAKNTLRPWGAVTRAPHFLPVPHFPHQQKGPHCAPSLQRHS